MTGVRCPTIRTPRKDLKKQILEALGKQILSAPLNYDEQTLLLVLRIGTDESLERALATLEEMGALPTVTTAREINLYDF